MTYLERAIAQGKALRRSVPRSAHGAWSPPADRPDPIGVLEASSLGRVPDLVPIRYGRMMQSAFAFMRGFASMMAHDLGTSTPASGLRVQACGDCHLENFGIFATPERNVVFDVNDFDETLPAPWEWDVKRLATSFHLAGRANHFSEKQCTRAVTAAVASYRTAMWEFAQQTALEVWYYRIDASDVWAQVRSARAKSAASPDAAPDSAHEIVAEEMTAGEGMDARIADKPPKLFHPPPAGEVVVEARSVLGTYPESLRDDMKLLVGAYELVDLAIKVVGIGSVGTRCAVALLVARERDEIVLQIKEARASVLEPYAGASAYANAGRRVVAGQRLMQVASDVFLGWGASAAGHDFYVRQLSDMKGSVNSTVLDPPQLAAYAALCGRSLAAGHARSGSPAVLAGYLGTGNAFDTAVAAFARLYADQTEKDYEAFMEAIRTGRLPHAPG